MKRRKKARIVTATLPAEKFAQLAAEVCPIHNVWVSEGYVLSPKSRLWKRADGTWTARFVHHKPDEQDVKLTMTTVVRGIVLR